MTRPSVVSTHGDRTPARSWKASKAASTWVAAYFRFRRPPVISCSAPISTSSVIAASAPIAETSSSLRTSVLSSTGCWKTTSSVRQTVAWRRLVIVSLQASRIVRRSLTSWRPLTTLSKLASAKRSTIGSARRHRINLAVGGWLRRSRCQGPLAEPNPVRFRYPMVAPVLCHHRLPSRGHPRRRGRIRNVVPLTRCTWVTAPPRISERAFCSIQTR